MLSGSAEAALLKTLEEAPEHVVFVLATTDPLKVAPTIRSRTQHFEFTLYTVDEIAAHLCNDVYSPRRASTPLPKRWPSLPVPARARCATRCRSSTRPSPTARSTSKASAHCSAGARSTAGSRSCGRWPTKTSPARLDRAFGEQLRLGSRSPVALAEDLLRHRARRVPADVRARARAGRRARGRGRRARRARRSGGRADVGAHARDARSGGGRHARHRRRRPAPRGGDRVGAPGPPRSGHAVPGAGRAHRPARTRGSGARARSGPRSSDACGRVACRRHLGTVGTASLGAPSDSRGTVGTASLGAPSDPMAEPSSARIEERPFVRRWLRRAARRRRTPPPGGRSSRPQHRSPEPSAPAAAPAPVGEVDIDDVIVAWAEIQTGLPPATADGE